MKKPNEQALWLRQERLKIDFDGLESRLCILLSIWLMITVQVRWSNFPLH